MASTAWTDEQLYAINWREGNLLVSAAAGTGKTAVLVGRIMSLIKDGQNPVDINRLLVVTYTNAAAAEMRERIRAELLSEVSRNPTSAYLRRQLALLSDASIGTIHSFCLNVVREHFYLVGLDPGFRLADETEAQIIQAEVLDSLMEEKYKGTDEGFFDLVDIYGGERDDEGLKELILKLFRFSRSLPQPERWLDQVAGMWNHRFSSVDDCAWCEELKLAISVELKGCIQEIQRAVGLCSRPGGPANYVPTLEQDLKMLEGLLKACAKTWGEMEEVFAGVSFARLKGTRNNDGISSELQEQVKEIREQVKERVNAIRGEILSKGSERRMEEVRRMAPTVQALVTLVKQFAEMYLAAKHRRSLLDFSDLEHYCLRILSENEGEHGGLAPSSVALQLQERFVEILVDEYQDINEVQEAIISLISRREGTRSNVFMVGDVKQSIYRFRLAEPGLFLEKYHRYPKKAVAGELRVDLKHNYRSRDGIIRAVNHLFGQIMTSAVAEIEYDHESRLVPGAVFPECEDGKDFGAHLVKLVIIDGSREQAHLPNSGPDGAESEEDLPPDTEQAENPVLLGEAQLEARLVAKEIAEMRHHEMKVWDREAGVYRPLRFQDIAVLLRTTRGIAQVFAEELRGAGIPAYAQIDTGYFDAIEVRTVLSLLNIIDNPCQEIPLLAVLRSPIGKLKAAELAEIRVRFPEGSFYEAAVNLARTSDSSVGGKLRDFFCKLEDWRTFARRKGVRNLLWRLYDETGYYDYVGAMPGGRQRQANLRLLETWAARYEGSSFKGLFNFLRFVEKMQENGWEMGTAAVNSENDDAVRVMSIHRSKGLEFPVVFVAGLGRMFNFADLKGRVLVHRKLGVGPEFVDKERRVTCPTLAKLAVKSRIRRETLAEEIRLLYVALTRAREKMVLVGTQRNLEEKIREWCHLASTGENVLPEAALMRAKCYLDWIGPAAARQSGGHTFWNEGEKENTQGAGEDGEVHFEVMVLRAGELTEGPPASELTTPETPLLKEAVAREEETDPVWEDIVQRLSWRYPWEKVLGKKAKFSVTEAREILLAPEDWQGGEPWTREITFSSHPRFHRKTGGLTAAEVGTITHLVLSRIDLEKAVDAQGARRELQKLVDRELISPEEAEAVDVEALARFCACELGQRVRKAGSAVLREVPFSLSLPAEEFYQEELAGYDERVLIQGVIDCLVDEGDGYLLIDYKTDRLQNGQVEEFVAKYRPQIDLYAKAVARILKKPVKEKYLYFLSHDLAVRL